MPAPRLAPVTPAARATRCQDGDLRAHTTGREDEGSGSGGARDRTVVEYVPSAPTTAVPITDRRT